MNTKRLKTGTEVRKVIPVEQGLRLGNCTFINVSAGKDVRKVIPVEQGLRPKVYPCIVDKYFVRKVIPVEQGLKNSSLHNR